MVANSTSTKAGTRVCVRKPGSGTCGVKGGGGGDAGIGGALVVQDAAEPLGSIALHLPRGLEGWQQDVVGRRRKPGKVKPLPNKASQKKRTAHQCTPCRGIDFGDQIIIICHNLLSNKKTVNKGFKKLPPQSPNVPPPPGGPPIF